MLHRPHGPLALAGALSLSIACAAWPARAQDPPPDAPVAPDEPPPPEPHKPAAPAPPTVVADTPVADAPVQRPEEPAKPEERAPADGDARTLRGHAFMSPALLDTAFIVTSAQLAMTIGTRGVPGVQVTSTNNTGVGHVFLYDRRVGFAQGDAALSIAFSRYVEADLSVSYQALLPGNPESVLLFGSSSSYDVRPGIRARPFRSPATGTQIGLHAYGVFIGGARLNPAGLLAQIAAQIPALANDPARIACLAAGDLGCALPTGVAVLQAMEVSRQQFGGGVSASFAQAFGSRFGAQATLGVELGRSKVTSKAAGELGATPIVFHVGVAPSLDLMPSAPIGAMIEYRFRVVNESSSGSDSADASTTRTLEHGIAAGLFYTGRRDVQMGVRFRGTFASSTVTFAGSRSDQPAATDLGGELSLRYFF